MNTRVITTLNRVWKFAMPLLSMASFQKANTPVCSSTITPAVKSTVPITLKYRCESAVRFAAFEPPMQDSMDVTVEPMF